MNLKRVFDQTLNERYARVQDLKVAVLGNGAGVVDVAGAPGYVWATVAGTQNAIAVWNKIAPKYNGLAVLIGYSREEPNLLQVVEILSAFPGRGANGGLGAPPHGVSQGWANLDPVWIEKGQFAPLRVLPLQDPNHPFAVTCYRDIVHIGGAWRLILPNESQVLDLIGDVPASGSQALYDLIYISGSGVLSKTVGSTKTIATLALTDIPATPASGYALAAIRLYYNQPYIQESGTQTDIVDLRWGVLDAVGAASGSSVSNANPFITSGSSADLTNYRVLTAGSNVSLDVTQAGKIIINSTASGSGGGGASSGSSGGGTIAFNVDGALATGTSIGQYVSSGSVVLGYSYLYVRSTGASGSTVVDVNLNGVSIFTDQTKRPFIMAGGSTVAVSGSPDVINVAPGDVISFDIDAAASGAVDLALTVFGANGSGASGNVIGSGSAADNHLAVWNGNNTNTLKDGGAVFYPSVFTLPIFFPTSNVNWNGVYQANAMDSYLINSGAQNDEAVYNINLPAGTYSIYLTGITDTNRGVFTVYFDGVSVGTMDFYTNPSVGIVIRSITGITCAGGMPVAVKLKIETKNGSSSGYYEALLFPNALIRTGA